MIDMGARSYVPQLGRFLQPDPQPGGSINSYSYTHDNPLNENDLSGEWSLNETSGGLSAVGTGEGVQLENGVGIAAGAIMPLPPDAQAEEAFRADPPWDQVTAGTEEYEEYEEEGGYGHEYISNHHDGTEGYEEPHLESGVLYQPLETEADQGDGEEGDGGALRDAKGGPGICQGHCGRAHRIWSHAGGRGGPTVGEVFGWGKEAFGLADCAYELATLKGACPRP
ncbi:MAG TPA: RHS repeat-associated core domain-containing protein [Solirubrobacteraceae bacterium]|nr:RHS repeat-associated core domain-containing protein [Solirubrobacteraceae bacterium]